MGTSASSWGRSIAGGLLARTIPAIQGAETIRATVVGAGTYTTTISGSTITYAQELFPLKNIPALKLSPAEQARCFAGEAGPLAEQIRWFLDQSSSDRLILALRERQTPVTGSCSSWPAPWPRPWTKPSLPLRPLW